MKPSHHASPTELRHCGHRQRGARPVPGRAALLLGLFVSLGLLTAPGGFAAANSRDADAGSWRLRTADFASRPIELTGLDDAGLRAGDDEVVEPDSIVELMNVNVERRNAGPSILHLADGDRLRGRVVGLDEEQVRFAVADLDVQIGLPLESLLALTPAGEEWDRPWLEAAPQQDEVILANQDRIAGFVSSADAEGWTVSDDRGEEVSFSAEAVRVVRFAAMGVDRPEARRAWRLVLAGGSLLTTDTLEVVDGEARVSYAGIETALPLAEVARIEQQAGPLLWLSSLRAAEVKHTPFFTAEHPLDVDSVPGDGQLRRGFVVRSRTVLRFDLPEGYQRFRTEYAIAGDGRFADADVRILLDGRVAHEHENLTSADGTQTIDLDLEGATSLTLEVDYGRGLDVQDRVAFIEPALLR